MSDSPCTVISGPKTSLFVRSRCVPGLAFTLTLFVLIGCRTFTGNAPDCSPPASGALDPAPEASEALAGTYRVAMVATRGPGEGARNDDLELHLWEQELDLRTLPGASGNPMPNVHQPLVGTLVGDLTSLGAIVPGELLSDDPTAPGVSVLHMAESAQAPGRLILRLGSLANERGVITFDGAFTALYVTTYGDDGFGGTWASGGGTGSQTQAGGYFCAVREVTD